VLGLVRLKQVTQSALGVEKCKNAFVACKIPVLKFMRHWLDFPGVFQVFLDLCLSLQQINTLIRSVFVAQRMQNRLASLVLSLGRHWAN